MKAYAVGVMKADPSDFCTKSIEDKRLWCIYQNFKDAEQAVLNNHSDMFECYYNFALIEEIDVITSKGLIGYVLDKFFGNGKYIPKQWWYQADLSDISEETLNPKVSKICTPYNLYNICCFWVG